MNSRKVTPMNLKYFEVFIDLVETNSFLSAATLNGISKAAVSQQLQAMERHFSAQLIVRSQNQFNLSPEGSAVYERAKEIVSQYKHIFSDIKEIEGTISGSIRISTIPTIGLHLLPLYLKKFRENFPDVEIKIKYRRSNAVYEDILNNSVDFGLLPFPEMRPQLETIHFMDDYFVLITHPEHALAKEKNVSLADLTDYEFISIDYGGSAHATIEEITRKYKIVPAMIFDNIETVKKAVEVNAGVAIVPYFAVFQEIQQGSLAVLEFKEQRITRPLSILYRKGRTFLPAMKKFIETLQEDIALDLTS